MVKITIEITPVAVVSTLVIGALLVLSAIR